MRPENSLKGQKLQMHYDYVCVLSVLSLDMCFTGPVAGLLKHFNSKLKRVPPLLLLEDICDAFFIKHPSQHGNNSAGNHHMEISKSPPGQTLCNAKEKTIYVLPVELTVQRFVLVSTVVIQPLDGAVSTEILHWIRVQTNCEVTQRGEIMCPSHRIGNTQSYT